MNPTATDPPPQPPQNHRPSFSCDRHPVESFTGFCPSCLCERLTTLDQSSSNNNNNNNPSASSSRRNSTSASVAAAALKSLFGKPSNLSNTNPLPPKPCKPIASSSSSLFPELRRTQSFSATGGIGVNFSAAFEPQRKSCDVRVRNTLSSLFTLDNATTSTTSAADKPSSSKTQYPPTIFNKALEKRPFFESKEAEEEDLEEVENVEIAPRVSCSEIIEEEIVKNTISTPIPKPMKDHIDLESNPKRTTGGMKEIAGTFFKKWHDWRRKQKLKKHNNGENSTTLPIEKPLSRQYRETQSEIADYGFGRRSCDTDPRFSLDAGRVSFDDARYSFDEPRASWDGHLIGKNFPRMLPLVEDAPVVIIPRSDGQIPLELPELPELPEDRLVPGGSAQTRDYYADSSSSRRRKSFERSNSIRKTAASIVAEIDELKVGSTNSNAKVSPTNMESFHSSKASISRDSNANSLRDDSSEIVDHQKGAKKSKWRWNLWGLIQKRSGVERSLSDQNAFRTNSNINYRNSSSNGSLRRSSVDIINAGNGKKREEFVLERNRSAKYDNGLLRDNNNGLSRDNGLLRFYLTPMRSSSSRRGGGGAPVKNKLNGTSHSIPRSVLRL